MVIMIVMAVMVTMIVMVIVIIMVIVVIMMVVLRHSEVVSSVVTMNLFCKVHRLG